MKPPVFPLPTPPDIMEDPEIAMLYLLFESLEVACRTIIAAHPILVSQERPPWINFSSGDEAAERLLANLDRLAKSILRYKKTITLSSTPGNGQTSDIPPKPPKKRQFPLRQLNLPFFDPETPPF